MRGNRSRYYVRSTLNLTVLCFCLFVHNNILWLASLSHHNTCDASFVTLGGFLNYWGLILLGLGPYFSLLGASLVIWQQHKWFLVLSCTLMCSCDAIYRSFTPW